MQDNLAKLLAAKESCQCLLDSTLDQLLNEYSALICYNDQIAMKVLDWARFKRINIPGDISLVSFDDSQLVVALEVKLTTVAHLQENLGEKLPKPFFR